MPTDHGSASGADLATPVVSGNLAAMLCYFPLLAILFLLLAPYNKDKMVRFHAFQCFGLVACLFILQLGLAVVTTLLSLVSPALAGPVEVLFDVVALGCLVLFPIAMVKAYRWQKLWIPFLSPIAEKFA